jgi:hypothetical protein
VATVSKVCWCGKKNGELLRLAEKQFDSSSAPPTRASRTSRTFPGRARRRRAAGQEQRLRRPRAPNRRPAHGARRADTRSCRPGAARRLTLARPDEVQKTAQPCKVIGISGSWYREYTPFIPPRSTAAAHRRPGVPVKRRGSSGENALRELGTGSAGSSFTHVVAPRGIPYSLCDAW